MRPAEIAQESKKAQVKLANGKEVIHEEYLDHPVNVGSNLREPTRRALIDLLKQYEHVFAWTPTDMVGVDREVIEHMLIIKKGAKEVK